MKKEDKLDADSALARVAKGGDSRFWEGFPVVLANSAEKACLITKMPWFSLNNLLTNQNSTHY